MTAVEALDKELERLHDLINRCTSSGSARELYSRVKKIEDALLTLAQQQTTPQRLP